MDNIQAFSALISQPKNAVVVTHFKPDADALGSSLGLAGFLKKKGHHVTVVTPSDYPDFLSWMPGHEAVIAVLKNQDPTFQRAANVIAKCDVIFCLDFSSLKRIEALEVPVKNSQAVKVLIDHHLEPESFADFQHWNPNAASTSGLVFELIDQLDEKHLIDQAMANCLYAGLMTDTGGFRHNNTTEREFRIAAELVRLGADPHEVARQIYDTSTLARLQLTGYALNQKLKVLPEYRTSYITITADELNRFGAQTGDTEGLVNYGLSVKDTRLSVLLYDRKEEIKLSLRSLGDLSVNEMARKYFDGGGHKNAAGGSSKDTLEKTLERFLSILPEYKDQLLKD